MDISSNDSVLPITSQKRVVIFLDVKSIQLSPFPSVAQYSLFLIIIPSATGKIVLVNCKNVFPCSKI